MGCGYSQHPKRIQKSTAIEILNEDEYNLDPGNANVVKVRTNGTEIKIHYRTLNYYKQDSKLKLNKK